VRLGSTCPLRDEEGRLECSPLRRRQRRQHGAEMLAQEIPDRCERKRRLRLGRAGADDGIAGLGGRGERSGPNGGLSDPDLAFDDASNRPVRRSLEHGSDGGQLLVPADDLRLHLGLSVLPNRGGA
jgi:hypothetical protein